MRLRASTAALLAVLWTAAPSRAGDSPFKNAGAQDPNCPKDVLLSEFYESKTPTIQSFFAWWHPSEIELLRGLKRKDSYATFDSQLQKDFDDPNSAFSDKYHAALSLQSKEAAVAKAGAAEFAQKTARPRFEAAAKALAAEPDKGPAGQFSKFEAPFLVCRMRYVGWEDAFNAKLQAATAANQTAEFVTYWRAFVRAEMAAYAKEADALDAAKPVAYAALYGALRDRTSKAINASPGAVAEQTKPIKQNVILHSNPQVAAFRDTLPDDPKDDRLSKHEFDLLWHDDPHHPDEQNEYYSRFKKAEELPTKSQEEAVKAKQAFVALTSDLRARVAPRDPDFNLSPEELASLGADGDKARQEIAGSSGAERKAKVAEYRRKVNNKDWALNLKPEELAAFGDQAAAVQQQVDALQGDARKKKVDDLRNTAQKILVYQGAHPGARIALSKDQLEAYQQALSRGDLKAADAIMDGSNRNGVANVGDLTGPRGSDGKQKSDALNSGNGDGQPTQSGPDNGNVPPAASDTVAQSDDGGGTWKKIKGDVPAIGKGLRIGIWMAVLGFFLAGPGGVALFAMAGFAMGYGVSKINKKLSE